MNYEREEVKEWGRTICRLRKDGKFHELISAEINVCNLTVSEIATACQTTRATVNKWKFGKAYPQVHFLWRLSKVLHSEVNSLGAFIIYVTKIDDER